ncbi:MAG: prolipoprotein diacylglyceryl transferase [Thermoanaerobaculia bacterium]|nr:prolipoprotein diacylglyceryl transferase [Thermoanaerobaculia bacterium]
MIQELFHLGPLSISPFGVMLMLAFLAAYFELGRGLRRLGVGDADDASSIMLWAGLGGIAGGKIYYAILYKDWHLLYDRSGLVWYGGFILGTLAILWVIRSRRLPVWSVVDAAAPALALGYAIGRIGCFLVGDDYGVPTDMPWGVKFPVGLPPTRAAWLESDFGIPIPPGVAGDELLAVHPTQLYETLLALGIWALGAWLLARWVARGYRRGSVALTVLFLLALERFGVEFFRAKDDRFLGQLTLAQGISLTILCLLLVLVIVQRRRPMDSDAG